MTLSSKHSFLLSLYSVVHLVSSVLRLAHLAVARQGHTPPIQQGRGSLLVPWKASPFILSGVASPGQKLFPR